MPIDLTKAIAAAKYIKDNLSAGVQTDSDKLNSIKIECSVIVATVQDCLDQICANDPQNNLNWLRDSGIVYDLSGYSDPEIDDFKKSTQETLQQQLDNSSFYQYRIVMFDLEEVNPGSGDGQYSPNAILCPPAAKITHGGPNGSINPPYPPH